MAKAGIARQNWQARRYVATADFVPALGMPVLELLNPQPGERILDLGCGNGVLSEQIAAARADVVAVDAAPELITAARARRLDARLADGQNLSFAAEFDAVFSNAALHWMRDADAVIADRARGETADLLRPVLMAEDGRWIADYVRLRFRARRAG
jgi:trans-aconitate methyltransferase